ncbi:hypothetical protein MXD60_00170 [Frankia sp. AgB32]|nr:hypothetical protein [Frankia sp. AgB32]MCK9893022.1 hypothetical protein [Frankia sp. AgB32]
MPHLPSDVAEVLPAGRISPAPEAAGTGSSGAGQRANPYAEALLRSWSGQGAAGALPTLLRHRLGHWSPSPAEALSEGGDPRFGGGDSDDEGRRDGPAPRRSGDAGGKWHDSLDPNRLILAAIDQFEELFAPRTPHLEVFREHFVTMLADMLAALPNLRLLLVIRQNFRTALARYERTLAGDGDIAWAAVEPLDRGAAISALAEPMRQVQRPLPPGVAAACVDDLRSSRVVDAAGTPELLVADRIQPAYLQLVAAEIWRGEAGFAEASTLGALTRTGGSDAVLGAYLTRVVVAESRRHGLDDAVVRRWLTQTFITERGRRAAVDEGIATTAGMPNGLLAALAERYVLAYEWRSGARRFELFDDRLIPPLQAAVPDWALAGATAVDITAADYLCAALVCQGDGDLAAASDQVDEALRRGVDEPRILVRALMLRAELDQAAGRVEQAERRYREAAQLGESLPDAEASGRALAAAGRLLLRLGRLGRAVEDLQAAAVRLSADLGVQIDLARALWYSGQRWAAVAIFSTVLTIAPESMTARTERGRLMLELGDDVAALDDLEQAVRRSAPNTPRATETRAARALALARLGRSAVASAEAAAVLDDAPDSGPVLWCAGGVLRAIGEDSRADDLLRRALHAHGPALLPHQREQVRRMLHGPGAMA